MEKFKCKGLEAVEPAHKEQQGGQCGESRRVPFSSHALWH